MSLRVRLRRLGALLLACSLLLLTGCDYLAQNWTTPMGEPQKTSTAPAASGGASPSGSASPSAAASPLLISEFMSNNAGFLTLSDGATPDWIELYNAGSAPVSLDGYMLSDNTKKPSKYVFKSGTLAPGACLLVYAGGGDSVSGTGSLASAAGGVIVVPFGLSSAGEALVLTSPDGTVADQWTVPSLPADVSFGRSGPNPGSGSARVYFGQPTPGKPNGADGKTTPEAAITPAVTTLLINEYCTRNATFYDEQGDYPDWVELYNSGSEPVDLSGFLLTDDIARLDKWKFPKVSLAPKGYILLMLSGKPEPAVQATPAPTAKAGTTTAPTAAPTAVPTAAPAQAGAVTRLQVDFRLSEDDRQLLISDTRSRPVAVATIEALPLNVSRGRLPDKPDTWAYFPRPTPGAANTTVSFATLALAGSLAAKAIVVSEVFAMDGAGTAAPVRDWIELYNNTDKKIDLTGYGLSDTAENPYRQKLSGVSIGPKSLLVIEPQNFAIASTGETIVLTAPDGVVEDAFATGYLRTGCSSGRRLTAGETASALDRFFYAAPTRGAPNTAAAYRTYADVPAIDVKRSADGAPADNLYIDQAVRVALSVPSPDSAIYYTLDGSTPSAGSTPYREPFVVDRSLVVKAITVRKDCLSSDVAVRTLLKEKRHSLPVISLSGSAAAITGPGGLLSSTTSTSEVRSTFTFYEADGRLGVSGNVGLELHGQYSRKEAQKSLEVKFRSSYGSHEVTYPFFPGYDVSTFRRLVLRTSGQDWQFTKLRDAFMTRLIQGQLAVDTMAVRNCVLYVNGAYYGLYELREKIDQYYVAEHYGVDPGQVDMIKGVAIIVAGDMKDYRQLQAYVKANDMRNEAAYQKVLAWIDEDSLMDFVIAESFFSNADSGNKKFWRPRTEGGQWRWVVYDLDWALFPGTYTSNRLSGDLLDPAGHGQGNFFGTDLQVGLMKNPAFREKFITRYANFINTTFSDARMLKILDDSVALIADEMPRQIARWGRPSSMGVWQSSVATLRRIVTEKRKLMIGQLASDFGLSQARLKALFPGDYA